VSDNDQDADLWRVAEKLEDLVFDHIRWMQKTAKVADGSP
jgi:hypothetical protein